MHYPNPKLGSRFDHEPLDALNFQSSASSVFQDIARDGKLMDALFEVCMSPKKVDNLSMKYDEIREVYEDQAFAVIANVTKLSWKGERAEREGGEEEEHMSHY
tara:strand:- start:83 stop:391 length:309 start_codon:yes stop_codon:yes gene_type:complete